uniref:Gustatory receptor n=1 Tax=Lutzomyia longipalpis TaxID=7200 RepID=A0A240SY24_LUTLO
MEASKKPLKIFCNIYDVLQPLYSVIRVFGSIVFTVNSAEEDEFEIRPANWIHVAISFSILLAFLILNIQMDMHTLESLTDIVGTMTRFIVVIGILVVIETTLTNRFLQKYLWKLLRCLNSFDKKMATLNAPVNHTLHRKWMVRLMMSLGALCFVLGAFNVGTITMISPKKLLGFFSSLTYTVISYAFLFYVSHFIVILVNIKERFRLLNQCFRNHFATNDYYTIVKTSSDESCSFITTLSKLHDSLNDSVSLANGYFALPMLIALTCVFADIVVTIFTIYCVFTRSHAVEDFWTSMIYGFDCLFYSFFVLIVITIASDLTFQGKFTATLIHKAINRTEDAKVAEKLKEWSLQMVHRQPIVTCGLFPYDWTLFYSIIAAICAYVTILIQFDTTKFYSQAAFNGTK